jgi:hypothetical protein
MVISNQTKCGLDTEIRFPCIQWLWLNCSIRKRVFSN